MKFGAHCSTSGGFHKALQRCDLIGGDICQIFVKNNMQWFGRAPLPEELTLYVQQRAKSRCSYVFGHAGYLINLASPSGPNRKNSLKSLIQEILIAAELRLPFLVLHPGSHLGTGEKLGLRRTIRGLDTVFAATKGSPVRIALENTAGQGSCLGHSLAHLSAIYDRVKHPDRLGICLDTAHLFAAGYDIRTEEGWHKAIAELATTVGIKQIVAFHLNDSKTELGSRVDRHAHIGKGKIGLNGFRIVVNDRRFERLPGCLETPKSAELVEDKENLATLRSLVDLGISPH